MGGWFLHNLEQCVEGAVREHVDLIDDIDLVPAVGRGVNRLIPQRADVVDSGVGGGVDLDHIEDTARLQPTADLALAAGIAVARGKAVDRFGEDLGTGGLAGSPRPGKEIGVADSAALDLIFQRSGTDSCPNTSPNTLGRYLRYSA